MDDFTCILCRYLVDHEMRLHIAAEDLGLYLHEESLRSTVKLPSAARELARIKEDIFIVQKSIEKAMKTVEPEGEQDLRNHSSGVHAQLQDMFDMKQSMVTARDTLEEAVNLSSLFKTIDAMLSSSDDLVRLSDALERFQKGLSIVGDSLPEFRQGKSKVAALEERVFDLAVQKLDGSLQVQNGDSCKIACTVLDQLGRSGLIAQHYSTIRCQHLLQLWEGYSANNPYSSWIPTFYDEVLRSIVVECDWCQMYLGEYYPGIILDMLLSFFRRIEVPCKARLAGATSQSSISSLQSIETMEQTVNSTAEFVDALFDSLRSASGISDSSVEIDLMKSIILPYDDVLKHYPSKEMNHMKSYVDQRMGMLKKGFAEVADDQSRIEGLSSSIDDVHAMVLESLQRCSATTSGTGIPGLLEVVDTIVAGYCDEVSDMLVGDVFGDVAGILKLLPFMHRLEHALLDIENNITDRIDALSNGLGRFELQQYGCTGSERLNFLRISWNPDLNSCIQAIRSPDSKPLTKAPLAVDKMKGVVESLIEKSFTETLEKYFHDISTVVTCAPSQGGNDAMSPSFSAYPLQYVISAGEQLMMLPQLLESSTSTINIQEDLQEELVNGWIDRLAGASCKVYSKELEKLSHLSSDASRQLSADIDYFCNIMNSLGSEVPVKISAWQAALATSDSDGLRSLLDSIGDNSEATATVALVARLRSL